MTSSTLPPPSNAEGVSRRGRVSWFWRVALALAVALLAFFILTSARIVRAAGQPQLRHSDAIVVFGAAEYSGRPSPVFRARLDHAYDLFEDHYAPIVITTGGNGGDPSFSEGGVGRDYLIRRGIPEHSLIAETQGSDTAQSAERVGVIMRVNGIHSALAVSDAYHVFRIRELLAHEGIQVYVAPRPNSRPAGTWRRFVAVLRESASFLYWKFSIL